MSKFKIGWTVKVINYGSAPKMTMESRGNVIEITKEDGVYWYGVKFSTKYQNWDVWWYEERNLEQVWPVDEKKYKRVFAKDIAVGTLCLGTDRSIVYKVKAVYHDLYGVVEIRSSPIEDPYQTYINILDGNEIVHVVEEEPMTTSVEDIQKEIAKAQETLNQLQKKLDEEKNKKWEPKGGKYYFNNSGKILEGISTSGCRSHGNEFETYNEAVKANAAYRRYHLLYKLAEELNEGWEPDWSFDNDGYFIYYDHVTNKYKYHRAKGYQNISTVHFKNENIAIKAIKIIENGGLN